MKNTKEINKLKRELVSRSDMKTIIKQLTVKDEQIQWLIEQLEMKGNTISKHWDHDGCIGCVFCKDETPDYQKSYKAKGFTNWLKSILP